MQKVKKDVGRDVEKPGAKKGVEMPNPFVPTPERVSQLLELKTDAVMQQMQSVEGREALYQNLLEHADHIKTEIDPRFDPERLRPQLELAGETLSQKERFLKATQAPEKKGIFRRSWERVKGFAKKHPIVTTLLVLALVAGGTAGAFYLTGNWELFLSSTGLKKILQGMKAGRELIPPTPQTPQLPDGGMFEIPPGTTPPDLGIPT
jgi:hypothetical protein